MTKSKILIVVIAAILVIGVAGAGIFLIFREDTRVYDDPFEKLYEREYDGEADYDNDGLTNDEEKRLKTDEMSPDTDKDGLGDYYEVTYSKTDPANADTDEDTLNDYVELKAGLNPLEKETNGTPDSKVDFEENIKMENATVTLRGNANIYNTYVNSFAVTGLDKTPGVMSKTYEVYSKGGLVNGEITFKYNESDIQNKGGEEDNLAVYTFEDDGKFKKASNYEIDKDSNTVKIKIKNSSKYLLGDEKMLNKEHKTKIMMLIDNSGSMFPKDLVDGSDENDVEFKRLDMAKAIIENINENVEYGLARFTATYFPMADIGTKKSDLFEKIESIRTIEEEFNGTYIATSIIKSLDSFTDSDKNDRKFIIILTDGESTEHSGLFGFLSGNPDENDAIRECNKKNVSVITIGLGKKVDTRYLKAIANQTGGAYIYANNADALEDIYNTIITQLVYSGEDFNDDEIIDGYVMADTGFKMNKNAFSFENFITIVPEGKETGGFCYGIAAFAQEFYLGKPNYQGAAFETKHGLNDKYSIPSFDVTNALEGITNLRDYKNEILTKFTNVYSVPSKDRYYLDGDVLRLNKKLVEENEDDYLIIKESKQKGTWKDKQYKKVEWLYIDIEKYMNKEEKNDDMEMVVAMYWHWALQMETQEGITLKEYDLTTSGTESEFNKLVEKISDGVPLIVSYDTSLTSGHAITAMRVLRDVDNPNIYYLICYDNNNMNEEYMFKIEQSDICFWDKTSISNWSENFNFRPYMLDGDKWVKVSMEFTELVR